MKLRIFFAAIVLLMVGACSQYTCPTYAQVEEPAQEEEMVKEQL